MAAAPSIFRSYLATNLRGAILSPARPVDYKRQFFNPGVNNQFLRKPYCVQKLAGLGEPPHIIANMAITPHDDHRFILHAFFQESSGVYSAVLSCGAGTQGGIVQLQRHGGLSKDNLPATASTLLSRIVKVDLALPILITVSAYTASFLNA